MTTPAWQADPSRERTPGRVAACCARVGAALLPCTTHGNNRRDERHNQGMQRVPASDALLVSNFNANLFKKTLIN